MVTPSGRARVWARARVISPATSARVAVSSGANVMPSGRPRATPSSYSTLTALSTGWGCVKRESAK